MIRIITGGIGSGKSERCLEEIAEIHGKNPRAKCLMLVNEHYSHETEKLFVERFGGTGLNNIEVTTFRKLSRELLSEVQLRSMTASGRQMLLYRTVCKYLEEEPQISAALRRTVKRSGFLDVLSQMINEMKHYAVGAEELKGTAEEITDNAALKEKLTAIARMYELYSEMFDGLEYNDGEDNLDRLAEAVAYTDIFDDTYMWIDKFDELLPQQMRVVEALYYKVKQMTVSVCYPADRLEQPLYEDIERTIRKIEMLDDNREYFDCGRHLKHIKSPELKFLAKNRIGTAVYDGKADGIKIFESRSSYCEVEHAAGQIIDLVREEGMRFRDIAVVCGNEEEYGYLIDTVFDEYEIPIFSDTSTVLSDHPIATQILSVFDMFENDFDYNSVFEYLKAGFIYTDEGGRLQNISRDAVDILENFVLRYGIRGAGRWLDLSDWSGGESISEITGSEKRRFSESDEAAEAEMNSLRRRITAPLAEYRNATKGKISCRSHAEALFKLLEDIKLYEGLKKEIMRFIKNGSVNEADSFEHIWELILEVLDQLVVTLGAVEMDREEFARYVRAGISKCEIRIIPSGIDRVYYGTAERNAPANVRALFILGANSGTFPSEIKTEGFLSDADRRYIREDAKRPLTLAPDTRSGMNKRLYNVFRTLTEASERLYISYASQDIDGRPTAPSRLVSDILRRFPQVHIEDDADESGQKPGVYITSPRVTVHKLLKNRADNSDNPVWKAVYSYYKERGLYPELIKMTESTREIAREGRYIPGELAEALYGSGKIEYSASRINVYAKCPYCYFLNYGLGLKERRVWDIGADDIGTYAHSIIEDFCREVESDAQSAEERHEKWAELTEEKENEILGRLFGEAEEKIEKSSIAQQSKVLHVMGRMKRVIKNAVGVVSSSLSEGRYTSVGEEVEVKLDLSDRAAIRGFVDRIDGCKGGGYMGIRIIDYKTGATMFDLVNIMNGVDMQMVLYAAAAKEYFSELDPLEEYRLTGIYYNHVRSDFAKQGARDSSEKMMSSAAKARMFDGMTFLEDENNFSVLYDMDEKLKNGEKSDFINVSFKKDGTLHSNCSQSVKTFREGEALMEHVKNRVRRYDREIRSDGAIMRAPYAGTGENTACTYCDYAQVCSIFGEAQERRALGSKKELKDMWKEIMHEGNYFGIAEDDKWE